MSVSKASCVAMNRWSIMTGSGVIIRSFLLNRSTLIFDVVNIKTKVGRCTVSRVIYTDSLLWKRLEKVIPLYDRINGRHA